MLSSRYIPVALIFNGIYLLAALIIEIDPSMDEQRRSRDLSIHVMQRYSRTRSIGSTYAYHLSNPKEACMHALERSKEGTCSLTATPSSAISSPSLLFSTKVGTVR